jgi:hypothetical protein
MNQSLTEKSSEAEAMAGLERLKDRQHGTLTLAVFRGGLGAALILTAFVARHFPQGVGISDVVAGVAIISDVRGIAVRLGAARSREAPLTSDLTIRPSI